MSKHTPGPWTIDWYECRADLADVKAKTTKHVGEILWQVPTRIGPVSPDENHWARLHLDVSDDDARLIAAAPELLEALFEASVALLIGHNSLVALEKARAAIAKATGEPA